MSELKNFEESLSRAKEHHAQMVIEYTPNALTEGLELVYQVKHDEQKNITGLVDEIETKIFEIVELYEEIETKDVEVLEGIETFVDELVPHLTKVRYNKRIKTPHEARGKHVSKNDHTPREIFRSELFTMRGQGLDILDVELKDNGIAGLIPPNKKLTDLYNEREIPKI